MCSHRSILYDSDTGGWQKFKERRSLPTWLKVFSLKTQICKRSCSSTIPLPSPHLEKSGSLPGTHRGHLRISGCDDTVWWDASLLDMATPEGIAREEAVSSLLFHGMSQWQDRALSWDLLNLKSKYRTSAQDMSISGKAGLWGCYRTVGGRGSCVCRKRCWALPLLGWGACLCRVLFTSYQ